MFIYHKVFAPADPDKPLGMYAADPAARTFDGLLWNWRLGEWSYAPGAVADYMFGDNHTDDNHSVSRAEAQEVAAKLGIPLLSDDELNAICERGRAAYRTQ